MTATKGGRYAAHEPFLINWLKSAREFILLFETATSPRGLPPIYVDYVANDDFNAFASEGPGQAFIGIYTGLIDGLSGVINDLLSIEPKILAYASINEQALLAVGFGARYEALPAEVKESRDIMSVARSSYAAILTSAASNFVLYHELYHIVHGHTALRQYISESDKRLEKQALEMDADSAAVSESLNYLLRGHECVLAKPEPSLAIERLMFERPMSAMRTWFLSTYIFFVARFSGVQFLRILRI